MKMQYIVLVTGVAVCASCFAVTQTTPSASERFAEQIRVWANGKFKVTQEEAKALQASHRVLAAIAEERYYRSYFWQVVRQESPKQVSWDEAVEMVRKGHIVMTTQSHDLHVCLSAKDGRKYTTTEPSIDEILKIVREVDPKLLFIEYITE